MTSSTFWQQYCLKPPCPAFGSAANYMQMSAVACTALITTGTYYGLGRSKYTIHNPNDLSEAIRYTIIALNVSMVSTSCGKLSALIFLVRLMGIAAPRWQRVVVWAVCGIMVVMNVWGFFLLIGFCHPAAKQWNPSLEGWCMDPKFRYGVDSAIG